MNYIKHFKTNKVMKYKIGQQYREYYSEEAYLTYTIIAMNNNYATLSVTHPNGDKVDAEVLGYIPDANGNIAVFPSHDHVFYCYAVYKFLF